MTFCNPRVIYNVLLLCLWLVDSMKWARFLFLLSSTECVKIRTNFNLNFSLYCASEVVVRESLLVNSHILKMIAILKSSAEYNRRAAIIEGLCAGHSATEIIRFFEYPRSTIYVVAKYTALKQSNGRFQ